MAITTELELRQVLSRKDVPCYEVEALKGGSANFCWRIKTLLGKRSIVKHAEPYIRDMPKDLLPVERLDCEHWALTTIPDLLSKDEHVQMPQVYGYYPGEHLLWMSDGGSRGLRDAYKRGENIDVPLVGQRLGAWLAKLHSIQPASEVLDELKTSGENKYGKFVFSYTFEGVAQVLNEHHFDPGLGERIKEKWGIEEASEKTSICHGDFWLANIQLEDAEPVPKIEDAEDVKLETPVLTIIDWENIRIGNGATDVARFAADAWMTDRFHGEKGMFKAFLEAYLAERDLKKEGKIRLAVHFAVHIIFYSKMGWTDKDGTKKLVEVGKDMLEAVEANDLRALANSPLAILFGNA